MLSFLSHLLVLLCVTVSIATPTPKAVTVIPGPGLPSLESLGVTSADLFRLAATRRESSNRGNSTVTPLVDTTCINVDKISIVNADACIEYLSMVAGNFCGINGLYRAWCIAGDAFISGVNLSGGPTAATTCGNIASGAQSAVNACQQPDGTCQGFAAAFGNSFIGVNVGPEFGSD